MTRVSPCYHDSRQGLAQAQTLARCSRKLKEYASVHSGVSRGRLRQPSSRASAHLRRTVPFCLQEVPSEFSVSKKDSPLSGCPLFYICLSNFEKSYEFMLTRMIRQVIHAFGIKFLLRNRKHLIYGLRIQAVVVYKVLVLHQLFLPLVLSALRVLPAMVSSVRLPDAEMMDDRELFGKLQ